MHESLDSILNLPEYPEETPDVIQKVSSDAEDDFEYTRKNLRSIIDKGQVALDIVFDLAKTSESPRAFEVASQMVKTLTDANKDLLELRKKNKEINNTTDAKSPTTVNNHLFVGSTAELQQLIKKSKEVSV